MESLPGRPCCSSTNLFSPQKPVQLRLVLGLWEDHLPYGKPTAYEGLLVTTHPVRPGPRVVGEVLVGHLKWGNRLLPTLQHSPPIWGLQLMSHGSSSGAFVLVTVLRCSGQGGEAAFSTVALFPSDYW